MAKTNGSTRNSSQSAQQAPALTFEQQVDNALIGLRSEFFQRMEDYYDSFAERWKKGFEEWKEKEEYISAAGPSASAQLERAREIYAMYNSSKSPLTVHNERERRLRDDYSDLTSGGFYKEGAKAPNFYALARGEHSIGEMNKAVKATAERNAEKSFINIRAKMLKSTVDKGVDLKSAKVREASDSGFLISDGKVTLHARYVLAWGEIKAPHFRFIITDRKN